MMRKKAIFTFVITMLPASSLAAQVTGEKGASASFSPVTLIIILAALSLLPFILMTATSFVKITVVFSILKNALGAGQIPPASVISGISIVLTLYVMQPVIWKCYDKAKPILDAKEEGDILTRHNAEKLIELFNECKEPVKDFLLKNSSPTSRKIFLDMSTSRNKSAGKTPPSQNDFAILLPSFLITELGEAFFIGFLIFLPFLVIELVVSNVLLSLGMHMLNPTTVSLPFKLLLFVSVSGWEIISRGLVMGYKF